MPIIKSAKKALRQAHRRKALNQKRKTNVRSAIKIVEKGVLAKKSGESVASLAAAYAVIDKAAKHGIMHKNKAARMKSRLAKLTKKTSA